MTRTISVEHTVSMGHRLPSYDGLCSSPHGHNMRVVVTLEVGTAFVDFKRAGSVLQEILAPFDHAMILASDDPLLPVLENMKFRTFPFQGEPTTEALAEMVLNEFQMRWSFRNGRAVRVDVFETAKYSASASV